MGCESKVNGFFFIIFLPFFFFYIVLGVFLVVNGARLDSVGDGFDVGLIGYCAIDLKIRQCLNSFYVQI